MDILVVGTHCLFAISEGGSIRMQKKLDYEPSSFCLYPNPKAVRNGEEVKGAQENMIISSFDSTLNVFREQKLIWSAKLHSTPIATFVANFGDPLRRGMIVTLSDTGSLNVSYLGTDPATESAVVPESKEVRSGEERGNDELRRRINRMSTSKTDTSVRNVVGATNLFTYSYDMNTPPFVTRFARRRSTTTTSTRSTGGCSESSVPRSRTRE